MIGTFDKTLLGMKYGGQCNHENNSRSASSWTQITYDGKYFMGFSSSVYDESSDGYIEHGNSHSASFSQDKEWIFNKIYDIDSGTTSKSTYNVMEELIKKGLIEPQLSANEYINQFNQFGNIP